MEKFIKNIALFYEVDTLKIFLLRDVNEKLSTADINLLNILYFSEPKSIKYLCIDTGCATSSISRSIKRLIKEKYGRYHVIKNDKRIKIVQLTKKGIDIVELLNERLNSFFKEAFSTFSDEKIDLFIHMFQRCNDVFTIMKKSVLTEK